MTELTSAVAGQEGGAGYRAPDDSSDDAQTNEAVLMSREP